MYVDLNFSKYNFSNTWLTLNFDVITECKYYDLKLVKSLIKSKYKYNISVYDTDLFQLQRRSVVT